MTTAPPRSVRRRPAPLRATVRRVTTLTPHLVRVTVTGPDLERFRWPGPAGHLKLILPEHGAADVVLPVPDEDGTVVLGGTPLTMRTYTARRFDPDLLELDLDLVLHGDGPAAAWAAAVRPGDGLAVSVPRRAGFSQDPDAVWLLLAGDASALPALATIAETLTVEATILVELDDPADRLDLGRPVEWLQRSGSPGTAMTAAVAAHVRPPGRGQVWVAGEAAAIRVIRAALLADLDRAQITTRGYWKLDEQNHPDHDSGEDA